MGPSAKKIGIADIRANVDTFYRDDIDIETFRLRNGLLWSIIEKQGSSDRVLAAIRRDHAKKSVR